MKLAYPILLITCVFFLTSPNAYTATYSFSTENGTHKIGLKTKINKKPCSVFNALTDYDNLTTFYSNLGHSKILNKYQDSIIVEQHFVGKIMNMSIKQKVILKVKYAGYKIIMEQIEGDFVHYRSIWSIIPQKNNTNMTIDTEFKVSFLKNLFVSKASLERKHKTFLENMTQQIDSGLYDDCIQKN